MLFLPLLPPIALQQSGDRILLNISDGALGKPMLWYVQLEGPETSNGYTVRACNSLLVRWERKGDRIELIGTSASRQKPGKFGDQAISTFDILGRPSGGSQTIDASGIFRGEVPALSPAWTVQSSGFDARRSQPAQLVNDIDGFHTRVHTWFLRPGKAGISGDVLTSLKILPENPLPGLRPDPRIGYMTMSCPLGECVRRFRLVKKYPKQPLSEPIQPIVFEIAPEVPDIWRPPIRDALNDWSEAFQTAGFSHTVVCRDAPKSAADPSWNSADLHRNVIRWSEGSAENATGFTVSDPRTGESISGHVIIGSRVIDLFSRQFFVQAGGIDRRRMVWPLPVTIRQRILRYILDHELGHVFGLDHNSLASSVYTVKQLRDPAFTRVHGDVASVMSYGRFNYLAQPKDRCQPFPLIGPYDRFALKYAYEPGASLHPNDLFSIQKTHPELRFGESGPSNQPSDDPDTQWDKIGRETLEATELGVENLRRVGANLSVLNQGQRALLGSELCRQWATEVGHAADLIGGIRGGNAVSGLSGPTPRQEQMTALEFVCRHILDDSDFLQSASHSGWETALGTLLDGLFDDRRLMRMAGGGGLSYPELLEAVTRSVLNDSQKTRSNASQSQLYFHALTRLLVNHELNKECRDAARTAMNECDRKALDNVHLTSLVESRPKTPAGNRGFRY